MMVEAVPVPMTVAFPSSHLTIAKRMVASRAKYAKTLKIFQTVILVRICVKIIKYNFAFMLLRK